MRQVVPSDEKGLDIITALHMELLHFGPMAQFGDRFVREIIYAAPLRDSLVHLAIAEVDGQPAGFIGYADDGELFHNSLMQHYFLKAGWLAGLSLLQQPRRLLRLPRALRVIRSRTEMPEEFGAIQAEVLVIGARADFLKPAFVQRTGLRVSVLMLEHAFAHFRQRGFKRVRVVTDADNRPVLFLYQSLGASFTPCIYGGVPSMLVTIDL
jgi:hypothetical protein